MSYYDITMRKLVQPTRTPSVNNDESSPAEFASSSSHATAQDRRPTDGKRKVNKTPNKLLGVANRRDLLSSTDSGDQLPRRKSLPSVKRRTKRTSGHDSPSSAATVQQPTASQGASGHTARRTPRSTSNDTPMSAALIKSLLDTKFKTMQHTLLTEAKRSRRKRKQEAPVFRHKSHQIQHEFNGELQEDLADAIEFLEHKDFPQAKESIRGAVTNLKQRNKKIKLADRSKAGWRTIKYYETDDLASDTADEKKMAKAEQKGLKEMADEKATQMDAAKATRFPGTRPKFRNASPKKDHRYQAGKYPSVPICFKCGGRGHIRAHCTKHK